MPWPYSFKVWAFHVDWVQMFLYLCEGGSRKAKWHPYVSTPDNMHGTRSPQGNREPTVCDVGGLLSDWGCLFPWLSPWSCFLPSGIMSQHNLPPAEKRHVLPLGEKESILLSSTNLELAIFFPLYLFSSPTTISFHALSQALPQPACLHLT